MNLKQEINLILSKISHIEGGSRVVNHSSIHNYLDCNRCILEKDFNDLERRFTNLTLIVQDLEKGIIK